VEQLSKNNDFFPFVTNLIVILEMFAFNKKILEINGTISGDWNIL